MQNKTLRVTFIVQIIWLLITGIFLLTGSPVALGLLIPNLLILFVPAVIERITRTDLPMALQIHFYIFLTASSLLGSVLGFYDSVNRWDTYVHLDSGVLIAWFGIFVVQKAESRTKGTLPKWFAISCAFALPMALASLWEIYEFASDQIFHTTMQTGGLQDTVIDMIAALLGAAIAITILLIFNSPKGIAPKSLV